MNYRQAVTELEALPIMPERVPSLEPTIQGLKRLELSFPASRVVIVAGTNGKGSVCACLEALLLSAQQTTGLYTSPHLVETTERFRRDGRDISPDEFVAAYAAVQKRTRDLKLTHFEVLTLMAYWIFAGGTGKPPVDWLILEVGLGGIWDSTNAIPHQNCIITSLGLDHQNLLGNSLREIAINKFGIIPRSKATLVHSPFPEEISELAKSVQAETGARFIPAKNWICQVDPGPHFILETPWGKTELSLPGQRAAQNATTALTAFETLGFEPAPHLSALSRIRWPGRMARLEIPHAPCPVFLSGDHNPQGIQSLIELLPHYPCKTLHLLVGIGKDKDLDGILEPLRALEDTRLYLTTTPFRGRAMADYGSWLARADGAEENPGQALRLVLSHAKPGDLVVVTGSLYLVGAIYSLHGRNLGISQDS